jgi:hypothetical protein
LEVGYKTKGRMKILITAVFIIQFYTLLGQDRKIDGRILAAENLLGIERTKIQTFDNKYITETNKEGRFTLTLPLTYDSLIVTLVGYETSKVKIQSNKPIYEILWTDAGSIYETRHSLARSIKKSSKRVKRIRTEFYKRAIRNKAFEK